MTRNSSKTKNRKKVEPFRKGVKSFSMECISDPKEVAKVEGFLLKVNKYTKLDDGTFYRLLVATSEAVNNGILHGNKCDPNKRVCVECEARPDMLLVRVQDEGGGFDPDSVPNPLDDENLMKTSGRGIFLMRSLMDKVTYHINSPGVLVELMIDLTKLQ